MFDPNKLKGTVDSLRSNAVVLRGKGDLGDVSATALELLLLRACVDMETCAEVIAQLASEKEALEARVAELEAPQDEAAE